MSIVSTGKTVIPEIIHILKPLHYSSFKRIIFLKLEVYWKIGQVIHAQFSPQNDSIFFKKVGDETSQYFKHNYSSKIFKEMLQFYHAYPNYELVHPELSWSHYRILIRIKNTVARHFYTKEAGLYHWTSATLNRQIKAFHFERFHQKSENDNPHLIPQFILKDLYILEFLKVANEHHFLEKELEDTLIEKLQYFLMELGDGYAFVARQKRVVTLTGKQFFIDLVFYHFLHKRFVLIELKVGELSHRDIGQLDLYVRLFDEKWKGKDDHPTIGIILCKDLDPTVVRYSVLKESNQLFAAKYRLHLTDNEVDDSVQKALNNIQW